MAGNPIGRTEAPSLESDIVGLVALLFVWAATQWTAWRLPSVCGWQTRLRLRFERNLARLHTTSVSMPA